VEVARMGRAASNKASLMTGMTTTTRRTKIRRITTTRRVAEVETDEERGSYSRTKRMSNPTNGLRTRGDRHDQMNHHPNPISFENYWRQILATKNKATRIGNWQGKTLDSENCETILCSTRIGLST